MIFTTITEPVNLLQGDRCTEDICPPYQKTIHILSSWKCEVQLWKWKTCIPFSSKDFYFLYLSASLI